MATTKEQPAPQRTDKEQIAWEKEWAPKAIAGAVVAALLPFTGAVLNATSLADTPQSEPGQLLFYNEHTLDVLLPAILQGLGALGMGAVLYYLWVATEHRKPGLPAITKYAAIGGPILLLVAQIASRGLLLVEASSFADGGQYTYDAAHDAFRATGPTVGAFATLVGVLALGFSFVIVSLNAMRVGLLTRFMGVLGIITGVLLIIPLGSPIPIVQLFWFAGIAALAAGKWPPGMPEAWTTGRAVPWATRQESMEARQRIAERRRAEKEAQAADGDMPDFEGSATDAPEPTATGAGGIPASAAGRKRKKKRR